MNGEVLALKGNLIETISESPDTIILLTNGKIHIVKESMQEVINKTIEYHRQIFEENILDRIKVKDE